MEIRAQRKIGTGGLVETGCPALNIGLVMARFDVYLRPRGDLPLYCQSDQIEQLAIRFTVPLVPQEEAGSQIAGLHPVFGISGERLVMAPHLLGAVRLRAFEILSEYEEEVQRALDG